MSEENSTILWWPTNLRWVPKHSNASVHSTPSRRKSEDGAGGATRGSELAEPTAVALNTTGPGIDLNCVVDHIQNPPEAFHYSYKWNGDRFLDQEVDVTPQTVDGTAKRNSSGNGDITNTLYSSTLGPGGFEKGAVWVTS